MALQTRRSPTLSWTRLLLYAGLAAFAALAVFAVTNGDLEAGMVAIGFGLSLGLLRFRGNLLGRVGIGILSAITFFFMLTAAVTNVRSSSPVGAVLLSGGLARLPSPAWRLPSPHRRIGQPQPMTTAPPGMSGAHP